ncbi:putative membrane protein [Candidatus Ichthyocystis hellenicum]|uniref:Putative membrane protein n=1 Tax=Candidatus Ichthyocystis hellenicum TaxID=1561003 RepID=A0A0S4M7M5_9BURK|nr:hypothetical protein [Candidatus Ichthyocystis hellenicum]CUT17396.1 putative membrane protein [Candidatus Ichthyocystis hellenicum]
MQVSNCAVVEPEEIVSIDVDPEASYEVTTEINDPTEPETGPSQLSALIPCESGVDACTDIAQKDSSIPKKIERVRANPNLLREPPREPPINNRNVYRPAFNPNYNIWIRNITSYHMDELIKTFSLFLVLLVPVTAFSISIFPMSTYCKERSNPSAGKLNRDPCRNSFLVAFAGLMAFTLVIITFLYCLKKIILRMYPQPQIQHR